MKNYIFKYIVILGLVYGSCENMNYRCKQYLVRGPGYYKGLCARFTFVRRFCSELCRGDCDGDVLKTTTTTPKKIVTGKKISRFLLAETMVQSTF